MRLFVSIFFLLLIAVPCQALVQSKVFNSLQLETPPLDIASSADGVWTFVLTTGGKIHIYSADGQLNDIIEVAEDTDHIHVSGPQGNHLYTSSEKSKKVSLLSLSFAAQIDTEGAPFLGAPNAPVTIVVFSDFQCPYCAKVEPTIARILDTYPDTVKIYFKHFPLRSHQFASLAALAAVAAQEQGKFWEYHDRLFAAQKELSQQKILAIAKELGMDMKQFTGDIGKNSTKEHLAKDISDGKKAGVRGTPSVFINGREPNKLTFEEIQKSIIAELNIRKKE